MAWPWIVLLVLGAAVVGAAEWPRVTAQVGTDARRSRSRERRKSALKVVQGVESDAFERSVQADLDALPTTDEPSTRR